MSEVVARSVGVSYPAINASELVNIQVPLPPLDIQRRIAGFLDEKTSLIDGLIGQKRALLDRLAEKRRALITRAVTKGLDPAAPMKPSGIDWLGDIPVHWEVLPLKRVVRYQEGPGSPFRHILVDEFQDISQSRARLVKALKAQHPDVRVFAVGDDWQSIFRFAGSDIHLMRHFGREFGGSFDGETGVHRTVDLGRTFRSVDQIAFAARTFVLRNPAQIDKKIVPAGTATEPAIRVASVSKGEDEAKLNELLAALSAAAALEAKPATVLLLGRYRFNEPEIQGLRRRFPRLKIDFKTIHASKGLEADHVVLLNADSGRMGFPSEIVDDPLLSLVSPEEEAFQNAEERRVMYVAMTRARHTLTILASNARPSSFVTELRKDPAYGVSTAPGAEPEAHICGECGGRLLGVTGQDGRIWYRCEHVQHCGNLLPACPSCGTALPRHADGTSEVRCGCGASYPTCPECEDGWLVERSGSFGKFLGCVRYPTCTGKAKISNGDQTAIAKPHRRKRV